MLFGALVHALRIAVGLGLLLHVGTQQKVCSWPQPPSKSKRPAPPDDPRSKPAPAPLTLAGTLPDAALPRDDNPTPRLLEGTRSHGADARTRSAPRTPLADGAPADDAAAAPLHAFCRRLSSPGAADAVYLLTRGSRREFLAVRRGLAPPHA